MIAPSYSRTVAAATALRAIAEARAKRAAMRIRGAGTWLDAGRPVRSESALSLEGARGIVEYVPGDLTMTVGAATTLGDIAEATRVNRQWLPLDPAGDDGGTIGATVATNSSGPLAHAFGAPRDQVLGLEFVTGAGTVVRGGGRVVKNVAGFDLTRLLVGSWGTLGVITEVSLRLRALPEVETTVALALPSDEKGIAGIVALLANARLAAFALEMVNETLAQRIGLGDRPVLLARLGGNADLVRTQLELLSTHGELRSDVEGSVWQELRACDRNASVVLRLSQRRSHWAQTWACARAIARIANGCAHGSLGRGVARVALQGEPEQLTPMLRAELHRFLGTVIFERLSPAMWKSVARPAPLDPLSRGVKKAFDPDRILNPGILGEVSA